MRVANESVERVQGVTVLGGEPTDQASALKPLLSSLRSEGLTTMVYTGYTLTSLRQQNKPDIFALLAEADLLVDGPFIPRLYDANLPWRGSTNQQIHFLSDKYCPQDLEAGFRTQGKGYSILIRADATVSISGLQEREGAASIEEELRMFTTDDSLRKPHHG